MGACAPRADGLFDGLFGRGAVAVGDLDWLQALLDVEAALARAAERAGITGRRRWRRGHRCGTCGAA